jgi:hypothetical protein
LLAGVFGAGLLVGETGTTGAGLMLVVLGAATGVVVVTGGLGLTVVWAGFVLVAGGADSADAGLLLADPLLVLKFSSFTS